MAKTKREVYQFCSKYIDYTTNRKNAFGIINYHSFDLEKIKKDKESIYGFFKEHFDFQRPFIFYDDLLLDEKGYEWISMQSLQDLYIVDLLAGFGSAAGIFIFDLKELYEFSFLRLCMKNPINPSQDICISTYLFPEYMGLKTKEEINVYLKTLLTRVFPQGKLNVEESFYTLQESNKEKETLFIKEMMQSFFDESCPEPAKNRVYERYCELLEKCPEDLYDLFVYYKTLDIDVSILFLKISLGFIERDLDQFRSEKDTLAPYLLDKIERKKREFSKQYTKQKENQKKRP